MSASAVQWPAGYDLPCCYFGVSNCPQSALDSLGEGCRILELGSFEGASTTYWIERLKPSEIVCVDTWSGSWELSSSLAGEAEQRFDRNVQLACQRAGKSPTVVKKRKQSTFTALAEMLTQSVISFDFIYVDASHTAYHALHDIMGALRLARPGTVIAIDDYIWNVGKVESGEIPRLDIPKDGVDAFLQVFAPFVHTIRSDYQLWLQVTADFARCNSVEDAQKVALPQNRRILDS